MSKRGLILFAHGARDPRWAEPFERLLARIRERRPDLLSTLAFLEHMTPDLQTAGRDLRAGGAGTIRIVPLFFGRGGHLREDFPALVGQTRAAIPDVEVEIIGAAGEDSAVIDALVDFALAGL